MASVTHRNDLGLAPPPRAARQWADWRWPLRSRAWPGRRLGPTRAEAAHGHLATEGPGRGRACPAWRTEAWGGSL